MKATKVLPPPDAYTITVDLNGKEARVLKELLGALSGGYHGEALILDPDLVDGLNVREVTDPLYDALDEVLEDA